MSWLDDLFHPPVDSLEHLRVPLGSLPVGRINQTWLQTYRECGKKALLSSVYDQEGSFYMFGGSVFHQALDEASTSPDQKHWLQMTSDPQYWHDVFDRVFVAHSKDTYAEMDLDAFAIQLANKDVLGGYNVGGLIFVALQFLKATGWEIIGVELLFRLEKAGTIPWTGALDWKLHHRDIGLALADTKTSGIWQKYFRGKSITKQTYSPEQVANHTQLTHYDWMGVRSGLWDAGEVKQYMVFTPANLTKYSRGPKAGNFKGDPFHWGAPLPNSIARYEEDLGHWIEMARAGYFPRMYPGMFGKLNCPTCPYGKYCLADKESDKVPSYLKGVK